MSRVDVQINFSWPRIQRQKPRQLMPSKLTKRKYGTSSMRLLAHVCRIELQIIISR